MAVRTVVVEGYSITAAAPFETVVARIDAALEAVVAQAVGDDGVRALRLRPDGVHLSYDRMASFLAGYGSPDPLAVARD
jgi:hypothetical protein